jgi:hypothetical protein
VPDKDRSSPGILLPNAYGEGKASSGLYGPTFFLRNP